MHPYGCPEKFCIYPKYFRLNVAPFFKEVVADGFANICSAGQFPYPYSGYYYVIVALVYTHRAREKFQVVSRSATLVTSPAPITSTTSDSRTDFFILSAAASSVWKYSEPSMAVDNCSLLTPLSFSSRAA